MVSQRVLTKPLFANVNVCVVFVCAIIFISIPQITLAQNDPIVIPDIKIELPSPAIEIAPTIKPKSIVPPGFESLVEPQTTIVDIYFSGEIIDSQMATFTNDNIEFSNPESIIKRINNLLDTEAVESALSGELVTHSELVCHYNGQKNCGELEPTIAGVIFNEGIFRAELFVNSSYLSVSGVGHQKYLPASDGDLSWLQTLNAAFSGSELDDSDVLGLNSGSTFALKENRIQIVSHYDNRDDFEIDTAVVRRDWRGMEYQAGYFRSNSGSFQFMGDSEMRGFRIASTLDTREDLRQSAGNSIQVFLRNRSEVSLYKDGRLISSRIYDAGNQELDTSQLPGGAYNVSIQIHDSAGSIEEETRFYVKSSLLPPDDQALYFVEAGEILDDQNQQGFAQGSGYSIIRTGYHSRLGDRFAYLAGMSHVDSQSNLEIGGSFIGRYLNIDVGAFSGTDNKRGARFDLRGNFSRLYFNANYRRIWNDNFDSAYSADFVGPSNTQANFSIMTQLPFGRFEIGSRYNRRINETIKTYTTRFELPRYRVGPAEMYMGLQLSQENGDKAGLFTVEFRATGDHVIGQFRPEYAFQDSGSSLEKNSADGVSNWQSSGVVSWRDQDIWRESDLRLDLRARDQYDQQSIGTEMDLATQQGRLRLQAENTKQGNLRYTQVTGNGFTSFMVNKQSAKLGGKDQSQSAVLINIEGNISDAEFEVLVNGNRRAIAKAGKTTALNLRPFETYSIQLRQLGSSFVEFEQAPKHVTLYPGNVITLDWKVAELNIIFGRLLDQEGNAIPNALIKGVSGIATTDDIGLFQAEIRNDISTLNIETLTQECDIQIPPYEVKRGIGLLGNLSCDLDDK